LKKFGKPIEKSKFENLVTLLQLTPFVEFLAMAEKNQSTRQNFPSLTSFQLNYWPVLETLPQWEHFIQKGGQNFYLLILLVFIVKIIF
jgi:hypothetical protein